MQSPDKATTLALRLVHAENTLHALTSGQIDAIIDVSGKAYLLRSAQENLQASERVLRSVIESIADGILVVNRGGVILFQSYSPKLVLGYEPGELKGQEMVKMIHEEDWMTVHSAFLNVIEEFVESVTVEFRHQAPDGSYRYPEASVRKMRDSSHSAIFNLRTAMHPKLRDIVSFSVSQEVTGITPLSRPDLNSIPQPIL